MLSMKTRPVCPLVWPFLLSLACCGLSALPCRADDPPPLKNLLENGGLEGELDPATGLPAGWEVTQTPEKSYKVEVVEGGRTGKKCLRISGEGKTVGIRLKSLPMGPDKRTLISGWMKVTGGDGTVSLMHQYQLADGQRAGSMTIGAVGKIQADWTQTSSIEFVGPNSPFVGQNFIIRAGGKIDALVDDLEAGTLAVTPDDLLLASGEFEMHYNRRYTGVYKTATSAGGTVELSPDDKRPANGRYCLRMKANADWATTSLWPVRYEAGKVYTLTGKVRVNSGRASIRIDYYKDENRADLLGSSTAKATESKDWQALSVDTSDKVPDGTTHITATAISYGDAEAFFDQFALVGK
jgi:hypothetical protein